MRISKKSVRSHLCSASRPTEAESVVQSSGPRDRDHGHRTTSLALRNSVIHTRHNAVAMKMNAEWSVAVMAGRVFEFTASISARNFGEDDHQSEEAKTDAYAAFV